MQTNPVIYFDENNPEHRNDFVTAIRTKSMGRCKNRYVLMGNYGSVLDMMRDKMINFYINQEYPLNG